MTDLTHLRQLMTEIGPALELTGVAEYGEQGTWALVVDADTEVWAEWDPDARLLVLSAELAVPPDDGRLELYETLLVYNHRRGRTGGVRISLSDPSGPLVLGLDIVVTGLDLARLAQVLSAFLDVHRAWREILSGGLGGAPEASEGSPDVDIGPGIKV